MPFSKRIHGIVFYSSLNELCQHKKVDENPFELIARYMHSVGIQKSTQEIIDLENNKCVIILDKMNSWVISSCKRITKGKISSLYVEEISELGFYLYL